MPVSEKLERLQEEVRDSKESTKSLLRGAREEGIKKEGGRKIAHKLKRTPITKFTGLNLRFFSMLIDFFTTTLILDSLKETDLYSSLVQISQKLPLTQLLSSADVLNKINDFLPQGLQEVSLADIIETNVVIVLSYFLFRLVATFIFGVSFGQLLFGIRGTGGTILKRVGGVLRVALEPFLGPFLIFDLPCLLKRRTLKEKLTKTGIVTHRKILTAFTSLFICPAILIYLFRSQLIAYVPSLKETTLVTVDSTQYSEEIDNKLSLESSFFRLNTSFRNFENYLIVPSLKIDRVGSKNIIAPTFYVYQSESGWEAELSVARDVRMNVLAADLGKTAEWLDINERDIIEDDKSFKSFSSEVEKPQRLAIEKFFLRTFRLHWKNLLDEAFVAKTGIVAYYLGKKHYWDLLNLDEPVELKRLGFKNLDMFLLSINKEGTPLLMKDSYLIPMTGGKSRIYQLRWSKKKTTENQVVAFLYDFFFEADFNFASKNSFNNENPMNILSSLDFFAKSSAPIEKRKESADLLLTHYEQVTDFLSKSTKNRKAKRKIDEQLSKLKRAIDMTTKNNKEFKEDIMTRIDFLREKLSKVEIEKKDPNADF